MLGKLDILWHYKKKYFTPSWKLTHSRDQTGIYEIYWENHQWNSQHITFNNTQTFLNQAWTLTFFSFISSLHTHLSHWSLKTWHLNPAIQYLVCIINWYCSYIGLFLLCGEMDEISLFCLLPLVVSPNIGNLHFYPSC